MTTVRYDLVLVLLLSCSLLVAVLMALRLQLARTGSGRLAQLRFRRLHGRRLADALDGQLDPRRGSPWIDGSLDGRAIQLVAAPVAGRMQAGVLLLDHQLPVNAWHCSGGDDELEVSPGVDRDAARELVAQLASMDVDSVSCGVDLDADPRPAHIVRMQFDDVDDLLVRLARLAPLLVALEELEPGRD